MINPCNSKISRNGTAHVSLVLKELSRDHANRKFTLLISVDHTIVPDLFAKPVISSPLVCVSYKLRIDEVNTTPFIWFKDEGGRDKCIDLNVKCVDYNGDIVRDRKVKLKAVLCYSDGREVATQDLLSVAADSKWVIEGGDHVLIRYRINEVSARHQSQLFCVKIIPDTSFSPINADIAYAFSTPVEIRSKRNNPQKRARDPASSKSSKKANTSAGAGNTEEVMQFNPSQGISLYRGNNSNNNLVIIGNDSNAPTRSAEEEYEHALNSVVKWTNRVVQSLEHIQWKPLGYAPNSNELLHTIPNPIATINDLMERYSTDVLDSLTFLVNAKLTGSTSSAATTTENNVSADRDRGDMDIFGSNRTVSSAVNVDMRNAVAMDDAIQNQMHVARPAASMSFGLGLGSDPMSIDMFNSRTGDNSIFTGRMHSLADNPLFNDSAGAGSVYIDDIAGVSPPVKEWAKQLDCVMNIAYHLTQDDLSSVSSGGKNRLICADDDSIDATTKLEATLLGCAVFYKDKLKGFVKDELNSGRTVITFYACKVDEKNSYVVDRTVYLTPQQIEKCESARKKSNKIYRSSDFLNVEAMLEQSMMDMWGCDSATTDFELNDF